MTSLEESLKALGFAPKGASKSNVRKNKEGDTKARRTSARSSTEGELTAAGLSDASSAFQSPYAHGSESEDRAEDEEAGRRPEVVWPADQRPEEIPKCPICEDYGCSKCERLCCDRCGGLGSAGSGLAAFANFVGCGESGHRSVSRMTMSRP